MKTFQMDNLTPLTQEELMEVEGGGILSNVLFTVSNIVSSLPAAVSGVGDVVKGIIDVLI